MERRLQPHPGQPAALSRPVALPIDYLKMVSEIFSTHFAPALKALQKLKKKNHFTAHGWIYPDEIVLSVSLVEEGILSATTAHASSDFDPTASQPTAEDLMAACVDALASLFSEILPGTDPEQLAAVAEQPLSAFEKVPFTWSAVTANRREIFLKVDKSNPDLEKMANEWLKKHDPQLQEDEDLQEEDDEALLAERIEAKLPKGDKPPTRH